MEQPVVNTYKLKVAILGHKLVAFDCSLLGSLFWMSTPVEFMYSQLDFCWILQFLRKNHLQMLPKVFHGEKGTSTRWEFLGSPFCWAFLTAEVSGQGPNPNQDMRQAYYPQVARLVTFDWLFREEKSWEILTVVIKWDPYWGKSNKTNCMVIFSDLPMMHWVGFKQLFWSCFMAI